MRGLQEILKDNNNARKFATTPRNLHNGEAAELVETVSGKSRKKEDKSILTEST